MYHLHGRRSATASCRAPESWCRTSKHAVRGCPGLTRGGSTGRWKLPSRSSGRCPRRLTRQTGGECSRGPCSRVDRGMTHLNDKAWAFAFADIAGDLPVAGTLPRPLGAPATGPSPLHKWGRYGMASALGDAARPPRTGTTNRTNTNCPDVDSTTTTLRRDRVTRKLIISVRAGWRPFSVVYRARHSRPASIPPGQGMAVNSAPRKAISHSQRGRTAGFPAFARSYRNFREGTNTPRQQ